MLLSNPPHGMRHERKYITMKKFTAIILCAVLAIGLLTGLDSYFQDAKISQTA